MNYHEDYLERKEGTPFLISKDTLIIDINPCLSPPLLLDIGGIVVS